MSGVGCCDQIFRKQGFEGLFDIQVDPLYLTIILGWNPEDKLMDATIMRSNAFKNREVNCDLSQRPCPGEIFGS